jgi:hypothetical protein
MHSIALPKTGFFTIATNHYVLMLEAQLTLISGLARTLDWHFVVATDQVNHLSQYVKNHRLEDHVRILKCPPYKFPLASMLRFKYIFEEMRDFEFICYLDCDMEIENAHALHDAIQKSTSVHLVRHPGWARDFGLKLSPKERLAESYLRLRNGGLGSWESRRNSSAWVPRKMRSEYYAGGIFFGPTNKIRNLSETCDAWMDADLQAGIVASVHDESYLNRWATLNDFTSVGPEYCYYHFPWLPDLDVVVRALDKSSMRLPLGSLTSSRNDLSDQEERHSPKC